MRALDWAGLALSYLLPLGVLAAVGVARRRRGAVESTGRKPWGTVYYALALFLLVVLFWRGPERYLVAAAMMPMVWRDGLATLVGSAVPGPRVRPGRDPKSLAGSLAMFAGSFLSLWVVLAWLSPVGPRGSAGVAASTALATTLVEAVSTAGLDNLSVPLLGAALLHLQVGAAMAPGSLSLPVALAMGALLAFAVALFAYRRRSLDASGVLGTVAVGLFVFGLGGLRWAVVLLVFFVTSSALTHFRAAQKLPLADQIEKGGPRDLGQVLANGAPAALLAALHALYPHPALFVAFAGVMAAATADTWATEVGALSRTPPRLITTWRAAPPGTSGAVTPLGSLAGAAGALLIGSLAALGAATPTAATAARIALAGTLGGIAGVFLDSLLGATLQARFYCAHCRQTTERRIHRCGESTTRAGGWPWVDNDVVNVAGTVGGGILSALIWLAPW